MTSLPAPASEDVAYVFDLQGLLYPFWSTGAAWSARRLVELVRRVVREQAPAYVAFAADLPFPTKRHELAAAHFPPEKLYKGDRKALDPAAKASLLEQLRIAEELLADVFGIRTLKVRGYEADDLLATLTAIAVARGLRVVVVALDRDLMQLVDEPTVVMWDGRDRVVGEAGVRSALGVNPVQVADYWAIVGGKNNIPGIKGLGEKAAVEILERFESLESVLKHVAVADRERMQDASPLRKTLRDKLREGAKDGRLSLQLARLDRRVPLNVSLDDLRALPFEDWEQ